MVVDIWSIQTKDIWIVGDQTTWEILQILENEIVETQSQVLEDLNVELHLALVSSLGGLFDLKSNVFNYWVDDLA